MSKTSAKSTTDTYDVSCIRDDVATDYTGITALSGARALTAKRIERKQNDGAAKHWAWSVVAQDPE